MKTFLFNVFEIIFYSIFCFCIAFVCDLVSSNTNIKWYVLFGVVLALGNTIIRIIKNKS